MADGKSFSRRKMLGSAAMGGVAALAATTPRAQAAAAPLHWHRQADIVVVGSGAAGLPAAIAARESGASVILIEAEKDIGGHAICSGGNIPLGGGTSVQKKYGIEDSADLVFRDLTDWSIVESNGAADYRYNDREIIRAFADNSAATFEWLLALGVVFLDKAPDNGGGTSIGNSALREMHPANGSWPLVQTGQPSDKANTTSGNGLMRPLEAAARKAGVEILLEHRMASLHRDSASQRVEGIAVQTPGGPQNIRARKAVILATGGSTGNVNFRRMFDVRLTEEYCGLAGMPWSNQDASGELAAMHVGASLWGAANQTGEFGEHLSKPGYIACQYGYWHLQWMPGSRVFDHARASGLHVTDWQNVILVNMLGQRFYDETGGYYTGNSYHGVEDYRPDDYRNAKDVKFNPSNFINAALAGIGDGKNGGGPIWAIFDSDAVARQKWNPAPPNVDVADGFFFTADTLPDLAQKIRMKYQRVPMPPENLAAAVARYNGFVDTGVDTDFGKPKPQHKIATPPFYAAWATPVIHDTRAGLRIDADCRVIDTDGRAISGLYCAGETAGGFSLHGLARCLAQGRIAGLHAAAEKI
jgi:hypothetical protein